MRKDLLAGALGFLIGAGAFVTAQEEEDRELTEKLGRLQEAATRLRQERWPREGAGLPPMGREGLELGLYSVYDLTSGRADALPPRLGSDGGEELPPFGGLTEEAPQPFGTLEELMELVRSSVMPNTWDEGANLAGSGQTLIVSQSPAAHRELTAFLERTLRDQAHRCVAVEALVADVSQPLYRKLGHAAGTALTTEQDRALEEALREGNAKRVFSARATGFLGQQVVLWHGRQAAVLTDHDIVIAQRKATADPVVAAVPDGGFLAVRTSAGDAADRLTLDVEVRFHALERIDTREDTEAGPIDSARIASTGGRSTLSVPHRTWALLGGGMRSGAWTRVVLVRATDLPRKGGGR